MLIPETLLQQLRQNDASLTSLSLNNMELKYDDINILLQALAQNTTLTSLDLWSNQIGAAGAQALAQNTTLTSLNLYGNEIGDAGAQAFAQNTTLTSLELTDNQIGAAGAQALTQNTTLTSLELSYNEIGDAGAQALAQNSTLTSLKLEGNQISDAGVQALAQNTTLTSLNLKGNNQIDAASVQAFTKNTTLIQLDFDSDIGFIKELIYGRLISNKIYAKQWLAACKLGDIVKLQTMLAQQQVNLYTFDSNSGATAWHVAVNEQQVSVMLFLLQQALNPQALFKRATIPNAISKLKKSPDNLFLQTVRTIESYSNAIIMNRAIVTQKKSLANINVLSDTLFSQRNSMSQSTTLPATSSAIAKTPQTNNQGLIFAEAQRQYYQHTC